jgi:hypothetical protein
MKDIEVGSLLILESNGNDNVIAGAYFVVGFDVGYYGGGHNAYILDRNVWRVSHCSNLISKYALNIYLKEVH